ncbi:MAG: hypothetical protein CVU79_06795 [Elusimicrobia bacterium HGW-Elusimicrobia-3]|nr:MAG: hypothetical protein CVU79_06795 [Elusimicrobia bacterium HGW-Elusimicrobia-3]
MKSILTAFKSRRGAALTQTIILGLIIIGLATAVIRWQLQRHRQSANNLADSQLKGDAELARGPLMSCLEAAGYPSGSCTPNAAQAACVPGGVGVAFGGTPPSCTVRLVLSR